MVLKFLGIGKKSEFVLEAPPAEPQPAAKAKPATEPAKPAAKAEPTKPAAPEPSHVDAKDVLAPVTDQISKATSKVKKTLKEVNAEKKAKAEKAKAEKGATEKNGAEPTDPVIPAPKPEPTLTNFATTLQANNTPRRRPGPSLDMFKDMAKQVNPRK
jgi:hypothetical protein